MIRIALILSFLSSTNLALAKTDTDKDDIQQVADAYLQALANPKADTGKNYLLGGVTLDAKTAVVYKPKMISRATPRTEQGAVADVRLRVAEIDHAGRGALADEVASASQPATAEDVSLSQALQLVEKTRKLRIQLIEKFPVFSDVIRADRAVFWHPKNPMRALLARASKDDHYDLTYVAFTVSSSDQPKGKPHTWPLRVVRFKTETLDSGWKVIPASDWDPETAPAAK